MSYPEPSNPPQLPEAFLVQVRAEKAAEHARQYSGRLALEAQTAATVAERSKIGSLIQTAAILAPIALKKLQPPHAFRRVTTTVTPERKTLFRTIPSERSQSITPIDKGWEIARVSYDLGDEYIGDPVTNILSVTASGKLLAFNIGGYPIRTTQLKPDVNLEADSYFLVDRVATFAELRTTSSWHMTADIALSGLAKFATDNRLM